MYCPNCKKSFPEDTVFCGTCGAPLEKEPKKKKKKGGFARGLLCGLLIMAVIGGSVLAVLYFTRRPSPDAARLQVVTRASDKKQTLQPDQTLAPEQTQEPEPAPVQTPARPRGYDSPKAAAEAYFDAARKGDPAAMLDTFALEEEADHLNMDFWLEEVHGPSDPLPPWLPANEKFLCLLNGEKVRRGLLHDLEYIYLYTVLPELSGDGANLTGKDLVLGGSPIYDSPEAFLTDDFRNEDLQERLSTIEIKEMYTPEDLSVKGKNFLQDFTRAFEKQFFGINQCDGRQEYLIKYEMDGETYYRNLVQICYDGKWYNYSFYGIFAAGFGCFSDKKAVIISREFMDQHEKEYFS